jgi:hypothetical protein
MLAGADSTRDENCFDRGLAMKMHEPRAGLTVNVVRGHVVVTMTQTFARQLAMVIERARPREVWLQEAVRSIFASADASGDTVRTDQSVAWWDASALISRELLQPASSLMVVVQGIADHVLRFSDGQSLTIMVASPDDPELLEVRVAAGVDAAALVGRTLRRTGSAAGSAMDLDQGQVGTTADLESFEGPAGSSRISRSVMAVPIHGGGTHPRGAVVVNGRPDQVPFDATDLSMAEDFARQTSLALELAESRSSQDWRQEKRESNLAAHALYDRLLQRLFSIGMTVQSAEASLRAEKSPAVAWARAQLVRAVDDLDASIRKVRASLQSLDVQHVDAVPPAAPTPVPATSTPAPHVTEPAGHEQEVAASLVHESAVHAAERAQAAVDSAAERAAAAASTARAQRSTAVQVAAEAVAARVAEAAAAAGNEADLAALTVARAAFDAALLIASTVTPGCERDAALTATLVATSVSAIAIKTAAVTAAARAEAAREAAAAAAAAATAAADAEKVVELEVMCAADAVRAVATEAALVLGEQIDAEAAALSATFELQDGQG